MWSFAFRQHASNGSHIALSQHVLSLLFFLIVGSCVSIRSSYFNAGFADYWRFSDTERRRVAPVTGRKDTLCVLLLARKRLEHQRERSVSSYDCWTRWGTRTSGYFCIVLRNFNSPCDGSSIQYTKYQAKTNLTKTAVTGELSNFLQRRSNYKLGNTKLNCSRHISTTCISVVLNNFIKTIYDKI